MSLNLPFKKNTSDLSSSTEESNSNYEFSKASNLFAVQRKKLGISLEELSYKTKISRNVLIAIESAWKKNLPEKTYLISILKRLEIELELEVGSLEALLEQKVIIKSLPKFNFINIDFLNSWIGSLLYFIFMLLSILVINSQQKYLLKINSVSTEPLLIIDNGTKNQNVKDNLE